jgi:hypothetical protein
MVNFAKDMQYHRNTKIRIKDIRETQFVGQGTENIRSWWIRIDQDEDQNNSMIKKKHAQSIRAALATFIGISIKN